MAAQPVSVIVAHERPVCKPEMTDRDSAPVACDVSYGHCIGKAQSCRGRALVLFTLGPD